VILGKENTNPENTIAIMKVTLDIRNGKDRDNTNDLMAPKARKTMQSAKNGQSILTQTFSGEEV
jgi:hypothetical protein